MLLKGNFETFFLASILQLLGNDRKTGILRVKNDSDEVRIIFKDGDIIYAIGGRKDARLSHVLHARGVISEDQIKKYLNLAKQKKQALDRVLVDEGIASSETLEKIIQTHVEEIIFRLFTWKEGDFEYKDVKVNLKSFVGVRLNTTRVLLEASRRIDEMSILEKQIPSNTMVFRLSETMRDKEEVKLNPEEWRILSLVDGKRSVEQIFSETGLEEILAYKAFYSLISSGLVEKAEDSQEEAPKKEKKIDFHEQIPTYSSIITVYLDVFQIVRRSLEADLGKNALSIMEKCKPEELVFHRTDIFKKFHQDNPNARNIHVVMEAMTTMEDVDEGQMFLIKSFNAFLKNILDKSLEVLGSKPTLDIIEKIEQTLFYVSKYQSDTVTRTNLVDEIRDVALEVQDYIIYDKDSKESRGGFFSVFKRKDDFQY